MREVAIVQAVLWSKVLRIRRRSQIWEKQDFEMYEIWSEKERLESKIIPRFRAEETGCIVLYCIVRYDHMQSTYVKWNDMSPIHWNCCTLQSKWCPMREYLGMAVTYHSSPWVIVHVLIDRSGSQCILFWCIIIIIILLDLLSSFRPRTINKLSEGDSDVCVTFAKWYLLGHESVLFLVCVIRRDVNLAVSCDSRLVFSPPPRLARLPRWCQLLKYDCYWGART